MKLTKHIPHLLVILMEECAEITKDASKALRFGPRDNYHCSTPEKRLAIELDDLRVILDLLTENGLKIQSDIGRQILKRRKLNKMLKYSANKGLIKPN